MLVNRFVYELAKCLDISGTGVRLSNRLRVIELTSKWTTSSRSIIIFPILRSLAVCLKIRKSRGSYLNSFGNVNVLILKMRNQIVPRSHPAAAANTF